MECNLKVIPKIQTLVLKEDGGGGEKIELDIGLVFEKSRQFPTLILGGCMGVSG